MCRLQFGQSPLSHSFPVCTNSCKNLFAFFIPCATFTLYTLRNSTKNSGPNVTIKCFGDCSKEQVFFQWGLPLDEWKWVVLGRFFFEYDNSRCCDVCVSLTICLDSHVKLQRCFWEKSRKQWFLFRLIVELNSFLTYQKCLGRPWPYIWLKLVTWDLFKPQN